MDMETLKEWAPFIPAAGYLVYHAVSTLTAESKDAKAQPWLPAVEIAAVAALAAPQYVPKAVAVNLMTGLLSGMVAKRDDKAALSAALVLLSGIWRDSAK
jgi:hypothetical protein